MKPPDHQVVVVGGGPAGLATSIALAQRGLSVAVIDRRHPPVDKACGEGLMPPARQPLKDLGVSLESLRGRDFQGIRYCDDGFSVSADFPAAPGRGVRRLVLHEALVARAQQAGVELRWGTPVLAVHRIGDSGWRVDTESHSLNCSWLVGADGLRSQVRGWAGLEGRRTRYQRFGVRRHFRMAPWSDRVEVMWTAGSEAYVTPVDDDLVGVALLWSGRAGGFDALLRRFPALEERLREAEVASADRGVGPLRQRSRSVIAPRLALVGDAAGYVDAITGEGLALAFQQALALADAVAAGSLSKYSIAHSRIVKDPERLTHLTLLLSRIPWLRRRVLAAMEHRPALLESLLAVQNGEGSLMRDGTGPLIRLTLASLLSPGLGRNAASP